MRGEITKGISNPITQNSSSNTRTDTAKYKRKNSNDVNMVG